MRILIQNGRLLDPATGTDKPADILVEEGRIRDIAAAKSLAAAGARVIDASGRLVTPGLIDLHVHLREPGFEYKEDIASGSAAAAAGGFTTIVAMPNTQPVVDNAELARFVRGRGEQVGLCRVLVAGAITAGQEGKMLAPLGELRDAGAVAVTDDGHAVADAKLMRHALEYARDFGLTVMTHADEPALSRGGHMHEGRVSTRLGLRGIPAVAEEIGVARDLMLAEYTGGRLHVLHVSTARAVELVRRAKARGARVTAEATPHHFTLTDEAVGDYDTAAKMYPPLRSEADRQAVVDGLADGTLDAIATDHAPHSSVEKDCAFDEAAGGIIGLQTALPLALELWRGRRMPLLQLFERLTAGPARCLGLTSGRLAAGEVADVAVIDPEAAWRLDAGTNRSKSVCSPWWGRPLTGRVDVTILGGRIVHEIGAGQS